LCGTIGDDADEEGSGHVLEADPFGEVIIYLIRFKLRRSNIGCDCAV
jgi:hypothetical protein